MKIVKATLMKKVTDDGLFEVWSNVSIGKIYDVDIDSKCMAHGKNVVKNKNWYREIITEVTSDTWLPTELLKIGDVPYVIQ